MLIVMLVLLTRGLHQDGLADTLDGLAGGRTPADRLPIMRDPRIGAIGATGLCLSLLLRYAGLLALPQSLRLPVLVCMPALGRWAMAAVAWSSPYAGAKDPVSFLTHLSLHHVLLSSLVLAVALAVGLGFLPALATVGAGLALVVLVRTGCRKWFGGVTGDLLGATNELIEILFLCGAGLGDRTMTGVDLLWQRPWMRWRVILAGFPTRSAGWGGHLLV